MNLSNNNVWVMFWHIFSRDKKKLNAGLPGANGWVTLRLAS